MTTATITKTINKLNSNLEAEIGKASLGFKRFFVLPTRVRRALDLAIYLETKDLNTHQKKVDFFEAMSEQEYINYLKLA
tara:strand:+ start:2016 stop:2252 length:237 start_codon:yes stop_codon:yes gene_type:complete